MGEYRVNHSYSSFSDGRRFGPYEPGTTVELDDVDAEWVNRDSPGTLTPVSGSVDPDGEAKVPQKDRAHHGGRKRAG